MSSGKSCGELEQRQSVIGSLFLVDVHSHHSDNERRSPQQTKEILLKHT